MPHGLTTGRNRRFTFGRDDALVVHGSRSPVRLSRGALLAAAALAFACGLLMEGGAARQNAPFALAPGRHAGA